MMKYDELIGKLRDCDDYRCDDCELKYEDLCNPILMEKAADAIEELQKPQWISVEERLPEENEKVLTFARFKHDGSWWMDITSWTGVTNHDIPKFWGYGEEMVVTHWMPLPEPPKEETDD